MDSEKAASKPRHSTLIEEEEETLKAINANYKDLHEVLKGLKSWSFDIFDIKKEDLPKLVERIFHDVELFEALPLDSSKLFGFVTSIMGQYRADVPYHNFRHACDVLHAIYLLLTLVEGQKMLSSLEVFALLLAALCHDVDHPGLNNTFLSVTNDPLAIRYNDLSILESHHASTTIKTLLAYESTNILAPFSEAEQRHIRKLLVEVILATDMDHHFTIIEMLKARIFDLKPFECSPPYSMLGSRHNSGSYPQGASSSSQSSAGSQITVPLSRPSPSSTNDVILLLKMIIKCADISNVMKPFFLSKRWAALLLTEWFRQGDAEKKLGLPVSKNIDSENPVALQTMTLGCIDFLGKPLYETMALLLPKMNDEVLPNLEMNKSEWKMFTSNDSAPLTQLSASADYGSGVASLRGFSSFENP